MAEDVELQGDVASPTGEVARADPRRKWVCSAGRVYVSRDYIKVQGSGIKFIGIIHIKKAYRLPISPDTWRTGLTEYHDSMLQADSPVL